MSTNDGVIFMNYSGLIYYAVYGRTNGTLLGFARDGSGTASVIQTTTDLRDGRWHHVAYVRNGSDFQLFVDCAVAAQDTKALGSVTNASPWLHVGGTNTSCSGCTGEAAGIPTGGYFTGVIDELAVYNRALSPAEIVQNGTAGTIACGVSDAAPTANAGPDQPLRANDTVHLNGGASFDDNTASTALGYSWALTELPFGSNASLTGANTATPTFVADVPGTYAVALIVTDSRGQMSVADEVFISSDNMAPTAAAGTDALVIITEPHLLDGSGSADAENDTLTYTWTISAAPVGSNAVLLAGSDPRKPTLVPDLPGTYTVTLVVSDFIGPGDPDSVVITAATAQDYAEYQIINAFSLISTLPGSSVTNAGNQNALGNFLNQAVSQLQAGNVALAIIKLGNAIDRVDGCQKTRTPVVADTSANSSGSDRDWITNCADQAAAYSILSDALASLTP